MTSLAQFPAYDLTPLANYMSIAPGNTNAVEAVLNRLLIALVSVENQLNESKPKEDRLNYYSYRVDDSGYIVHTCRFPLAAGSLKISSGD